jgi:hypothetical protein
MASQAYFVDDGKGDFYQCVAGASAGQSPATHPAKWVKLGIPEQFTPFLVHRALALVLTGEGQADKALVADGISTKRLEVLAFGDRIERGGLNRPNVFTR